MVVYHPASSLALVERLLAGSVNIERRFQERSSSSPTDLSGKSSEAHSMSRKVFNRKCSD